MKLKNITFLCAAAALFACSPEDPEMFDTSNYRVDKVVCQAESNYLVADGMSQLQLEVKLYYQSGDSYLEVKPARWREHDIRFFLEDGTQVNTPYMAESANPSTLRFYAEVDGMRSSEPIPQIKAGVTQTGPVYFEVNVREAVPVPEKKRIPVVFHLVDTQHNQNVGQIIQTDAVDYVIDLWNNVFSRSEDRASNGANPNLEFVRAVRNPAGKRLEEPGINRVLLSNEEMTRLTNEKVDFVWNNSDRLLWDVDRYLNVWVFFGTIAPSTYNTMDRGFPFVYETGVYDAAALPLPSSPVAFKNMLRHLTPAELEAWKENPGSVISTANYLEQLGVLFTKNGFATRRSNFITPLAIHMGLIVNTAVLETTHRFFGGSGSSHVDDMCDDTPKYDIWFWGDPGKGGIEASYLGTSQIKYMRHAPWAVFRSTNVVEYPNSFQTTISQDQAARIDWVLNNAAARQAWKNTYAID